MPDLPFAYWPEDAVYEKSADIAKAYRRGLAGCEWNPRKIFESNELFDDTIRSYRGMPNGEDVSRVYGFEDHGKDRLSCNFLDVEKLYPEALPGPAQVVGDCVSHSQAKADLTTICTEICRGNIDEISGLTEGPPKVTLEGQQNGVLSSSYTYGWRGYNSHGWQCSIGARVSTVHGVLLCTNYPGVTDLTRYTKATATKWGRNFPPEELDRLGRMHLIRTSTRVSGMEQLRDFISAGFGITSCGSQSFSSVRDENGVSRRTRTGWSHALSVLAFDSRPTTLERYPRCGGGLGLLVNSWGKNWIRGSRKILGTNLLIPHGSFWAQWSDIKHRSFYAMSSAMGWKPRRRHRISTRLG